MSQTRQNQSLFPDLPRAQTVIDKDGSFTQLWSLGFSQLFQTLQLNLKNEGFLIPSLSADDIDSIEDLYIPFIGMPFPSNPPLSNISGQMVYDATNNVPKMFIITLDGSTPPNILTAAWKTFTLT